MLASCFLAVYRSGVVRIELQVEMGPAGEDTLDSVLRFAQLPIAVDSSPGEGLSLPDKGSRMRDLLSIGRFSEATGLTVKALRLYDKLDLLRPEVVDLSSGYRYYNLDQVAAAQRIHFLRSLYMPLSDIRALLDDDGDAAEVLVRHRLRLAEQLADCERALRLLPTPDRWCQDGREDFAMSLEGKTYQCSFCKKTNADVERMVAGPRGVVICNECVALATDLMSQAKADEARA